MFYVAGQHKNPDSFVESDIKPITDTRSLVRILDSEKHTGVLIFKNQGGANFVKNNIELLNTTFKFCKDYFIDYCAGILMSYSGDCKEGKGMHKSVKSVTDYKCIYLPASEFDVLRKGVDLVSHINSEIANNNRLYLGYGLQHTNPASPVHVSKTVRARGADKPALKRKTHPDGPGVLKHVGKVKTGRSMTVRELWRRKNAKK